ncbi:hypothetical protein J2X63_000535 [Agromyces sp. 3263]|uniref:IPT/TIG domain-containing protein n=1 Tax=Agromyces sp. 3263 TaxID=2817750 RepID=UPI0028679B80|nr:IPT/TIG domain-containing protein [Agromyces sp. 3263]MDR6904849.1 hypothetical protein [Agromyces sp. 3263]
MEQQTRAWARIERDRKGRGRRLRFRTTAFLSVVAVLAAGGALTATAAPGDTSYAEGQFLSGSLLDSVDLSGVVGIDGESATSDGVTPETNAQNLDLTALGIVNVDVGGGIQLPIDFVDAGVVGQYANAETDGSSLGASGLISDTGAIGTGITPAPGLAPGPLGFDLADLLGAEFAGTITDLDLEVGAVSAQAEVTAGGTPVGDYEIASAVVQVDSPAIAGIAGTVNDAVAGLQGDVDALAGPGGSLVNGVLGAVDDLLLGVGIGSATATVDVDLAAAVAPILSTPLDSGGGVVIDLAAGTITLDLDQLVGGLNSVPPSTELLSAAVLTEVTTQVADLIDGLVDDLGTAITTALENAAVAVEVTLTAPVLGTPLVTVTVDGTLLEVVDGNAAVAIDALGVPIIGLTDAVILAALGPIVNAVIDSDTGALGTLLTTLTDDVLNPVIDALNPAILLLDTVVSLLANVQEPEPPVAGAVFQETALRLSVLPTAIVPGLLELNLARALVGPNLVAPVLLTLTPDEGPTAGGTLVTIDGTALAGPTAVTIDGVSVPFTQVSDTQVSFTTPPHAAGPVDVTVTTAAGVSAPLPFTFVPAPVLTVLTPDEGPVAGGTPVTITGTDLAGATEVTIDGASVPFTQVSDTEITLVTPPHAAGPVDVIVETPGGPSNALPFTFVPAPVLTALTPDEGPVAGGTPVTITGTDLAGATEVTIDGASVPFTQVSDTEITFTTPPHAAGPVDVVVTTPGGDSNALPFTYVPAPSLIALTPDEGPAAGGTLVSITGTNLGGATAVTIDGASVPFTQVSATEVTFVTPPHLPGPVDVTVTTPGGVSGPLAFTYLPGPVILSLTPEVGPVAGGTLVTITGSGLTGATDVTIDGVPVAFTPVSDTEVTFVTPPHAAGPVDVVVSTPGGDTNPLPFTYLDVPALTALTPDEGPTIGGTIVTITGTALAEATEVTIDGVSVPFTQVSDTEIAFVTPPHAAGPVDVVVITPGGTSNPLPFTYVPAPVLTVLTPDEGPVAGGTPVTITGTDLAGATEVTIDGASVPFTQVSDTEITFVTPPHAAGPVDVIVETPGGPSNALPFTYVPAPVLTALTPDEGPVAGGTPVTITGTDLAGATEVTIDGTSVPFTQVSDTEITFTTPPHAAGPVDVVVTTPGGDSNALPFTYVPAPVLTALSPADGPETGGTEVTITGTDLGGATSVTVDGEEVDFTVVDDATITIVTPPHAAGPVDVVVTTPGGASPPLEFEYTPVTTIDGIAPGTGPEAGGTQVTITGHCFAGATAVWFGDVPATSFEVVDDTTIIAVAPAGVGTVDVTVVGSEACGDATAEGGFAYTPAAGAPPAAGPGSGQSGTTSGIASTGFDPTPWLGGALVVLLAGALMLLSRRRGARG